MYPRIIFCGCSEIPLGLKQIKFQPLIFQPQIINSQIMTLKIIYFLLPNFRIKLNIA